MSCHSKTVWLTIIFHKCLFLFLYSECQWSPMLFGCHHSSKYLLLCSTEERKSYWFETTWWWVNDKWCTFLVNYPFNIFEPVRLQYYSIKGIVHPKMKIKVEPPMSQRCPYYLSGPWMCQLRCCLWRVRKLSDFTKKYLDLCSKDERRSYGFGITWGTWE